MFATVLALGMAWILQQVLKLAGTFITTAAHDFAIMVGNVSIVVFAIALYNRYVHTRGKKVVYTCTLT